MHHTPTGDVEGDAGDVVSFAGCQEHCRGPDLIQTGQPPQRDAFHERPLVFVLAQPRQFCFEREIVFGQHVCVYTAGTDGIGCYVVLAGLFGK